MVLFRVEAADDETAATYHLPRIFPSADNVTMDNDQKDVSGRGAARSWGVLRCCTRTNSSFGCVVVVIWRVQNLHFSPSVSCQ